MASIGLCGGGASLTGDMTLQGAEAATNLGILKFSRKKHESETDESGLYFMAAGYDPQQAPALWEGW